MGKRNEEWLARAEKVVRRIVAENHDRPSLVSEIACKIGAEIVEGVRLPGDDLNSVELSRRFATSRTPIREALMLLEKQGLVSVPPRRRPAVSALAISHVRELYAARGALLELVAAEIAKNAPDQALDRLADSISVMQDSMHDLSAYIWENVDFYDIMTEVAGNSFVKRIVDSLLLRTIPLRRISLSQPGRLAKSLDDHIRLLRAFEERDDNLAAALIRANHRTALVTLENAMKTEDRARTDRRDAPSPQVELA